MSFKSVVLGTSARKSYTHDMSFDNNTTMEFGVLQPLMSQYMEPNARISVNTRQLVRLAPMPTPSFARLYVQNYARFVKMTDVVPYFECLLSKIPYSGTSRTYMPTQMPQISNNLLMYYILTNSDLCVYEMVQPQQYKAYSSSSVNSLPDDFAKLFDACFNSSLVRSKLNYSVIGKRQNYDITIPSADYTLYLGNEGMQSKYIVCFRYSQKVKRFRKQLIGLGYGLCVDDKHALSFAPLLAYYKSYFDIFGISREFPFETTNCFKLIKLIEEYDIYFDSGQLSVSYDKMNLLFAFFDDLSNVFYTDASSYIAAHRSKILNGVQNVTLDLNGVSPNTVSYNSGSNSYPQIGLGPTSSATQPVLSNLSLDALRRLTRFLSKDSVIGKRLSDWVRTHYGAEVSNSLFEQSFNLGSWRTNIDIDDIFNTSDTADIGNKDTGENLGAYAGKGIGFGKNGFSFRSPVHGYIFVMSCIVPVVKDFIGNDPTLFAIDYDTIPIPEYDALGYELTPSSVFLGDNSLYSSLHPLSLTNSSFGYVPRYTGHKVKKNIVNGDMYGGYFKTDLQPYYLDRIIVNNSETVTLPSTEDEKDDKDKVYNVVSTFSAAPRASTEWQKLCKYGFLGNYNRLFYNSPSTFGYNVNNFSHDDVLVDDNFIVQSVFDVKLKNWLKPIQNSYDTVDETDNSTVNVTTN